MILEDDLKVAQTGRIIVSACPFMSQEAQAEQVGYYLCIENQSPSKIHILSKDWHITDEKGNMYCDNSVGFDGEIPALEPGECFEFSSVAPKISPNAVFYGTCQIKSDEDSCVKDIKIPAFSLNPQVSMSNAGYLN